MYHKLIKMDHYPKKLKNEFFFRCFNIIFILKKTLDEHQFWELALSLKKWG